MQALIDFLVRNLLALWPIARVRSDKQGLRVRGGIFRDELPPGLHWRWWFIDEVLSWPTNIQAYDLPTAAITTTDGVPVAISANVAIRMTSIRQMYVGIWNVHDSLKQVAIGEIATHCAQEDWPTLRSNRARLEGQLAQALNRRVHPWGLVVDRVHVTDLVQTRSHRHYVEGMKAR